MLRSGSTSRLALAAAASSRAVATRPSRLGSLPLAEGHEAHDDRPDQEDRGRGEQAAEPPVGAGSGGGLALGRRPALVALGLAGVEEGSFGLAELVVVVGGPVGGRTQAGAAVELGGVVTGGVPGAGGIVQPPVQPAALDVLVEPGAQTGPLPQ